MVERITDPTIPGFLTFYDGRVPDGQTVKQPRPAPAPTRREWLRVFGAVVVVVALALLIRWLR